jgi:hypothetical protein
MRARVNRRHWLNLRKCWCLAAAVTSINLLPVTRPPANIEEALSSRGPSAVSGFGQSKRSRNLGFLATQIISPKRFDASIQVRNNCGLRRKEQGKEPHRDRSKLGPRRSDSNHGLRLRGLRTATREVLWPGNRKRRSDLQDQPSPGGLKASADKATFDSDNDGANGCDGQDNFLPKLYNSAATIGKISVRPWWRDRTVGCGGWRSSPQRPC